MAHSGGGRTSSPIRRHPLALTSWRSRHERLWRNQAVLRVLRNPVYLGKIAHGEQTYDEQHEPIIDAHIHAHIHA